MDGRNPIFQPYGGNFMKKYLLPETGNFAHTNAYFTEEWL